MKLDDNVPRMLSLINQFVYRPDATFAPAGFTPSDLGLAYEEAAIETADGLALSGWYLPARDAHHALLYCHGNGGDIRDWVHAAPPFLEAGISVLMWDYRGYGRSQGAPSEAGLYLDGESAWAWLKRKAGGDGLTASILGKSLGSAVGIHLAVSDPPARLILDSAFTSMREVVALNATWLPAAALPRLFESLDLAPRIACPTLLIHGGRDELVPPSHGRRIFEALTCPKHLHVIPAAGHNDISAFSDYQRQIGDFLLGDG